MMSGAWEKGPTAPLMLGSGVNLRRGLTLNLALLTLGRHAAAQAFGRGRRSCENLPTQQTCKPLQFAYCKQLLTVVAYKMLTVNQTSLHFAYIWV